MTELDAMPRAITLHRYTIENKQGKHTNITHAHAPQQSDVQLPSAQQASLEARLAVTFINGDPADKYELASKPIGQGGMGTIYLGTNKKTEK